MIRAGAVAAGLAALLGGAAPAGAAQIGVAIPGRSFQPPRVTVVAGDTVTWRNGDGVAHDLLAGDGEFGSGLLAPGATYSHRFTAPGAHPYVCTIHTGMTGEVDVVPVLLEAPAAPPVSGQRFALAGRAPAGSGPLSLQRSVGDGPFETVGAAIDPGTDGSFAVGLTAGASADWRVVDGSGATSPAVTVPVAPRVTISLRARRTRSLVVLSVRTSPVRPRERVVLELYSRERFAWLRAGTAQLDAAGRTTFSVRRGLRRRARIRYVSGGAPVHSRAIALWRARSAAPGGRWARRPSPVSARRSGRR